MTSNSIKSPKGNGFNCEGSIIHYMINVPVDEQEALWLHNAGTQCIDKKKISLILIDIQKSTQFSAAARKIWVKFLKNPRIKKAAIFGGNVFVRTLASFVIAAAGKKSIKFFSTRKEALTWLDQ